ncbi:MAG TPA: hypothetical protein PK467_16645, partial [Candidatus Wallbacteria bacterium]|nr:hypothetical protein [Candidatus Wallbacteria bacterium]
YYYNYSGYTDWKYFGVDLNKPAVTLTSPNDGKAFCSNTSVSFMFSANDYYSGLNTSSTVSYMEIRKGSTGGALEGKYPITSGNNTINHNFTSPGTYYWHVVAKDNTNASNSIPSPHAATDSGWRSLTIDNVPPYTPTLSSPVGNVWKTTSTITFSWSAVTDQPPGTGIDAYYLKIKKPDGSDWPGYGEPYGKKLPNNLTSHSASGFAETPPSGSYTWYVYAEDTCGNKSVSAAGKFRVDLTDPSISITSPKSNGFPDNYIYNEYTASSVEFKATYSDNISGVKDANLSVYRPGPVVMPAPFGWTAAYAEYTTPRTISEFNDCKTGTYNGLWRADGFVRDHAGRTVSLSKNFQVDVTRPVISPGTGSNGNITKVASVDMTARPINDPDPPVIKTATPTIQWTSATEGAGQSGIANYFVKVWDSAGNLVVNPSGGVGIDAGATQSYTIPTPLATGLYYFEVSVTDKAKNGAVQNVDGISENNQTFYTSNDLIYTNKRRFRIDLEPPYVKGFTPPTPKSGNGMVDWVVSTNPSYTGEMKDTYGLSEYKIRLYSKNGASYTYITERQVTTGLPTGNTLYTIPNLTITTLNDGYYGFEIEAWDRATSPEPRQSAIAPATAPTLRYD